MAICSRVDKYFTKEHKCQGTIGVMRIQRLRNINVFMNFLPVHPVHCWMSENFDLLVALDRKVRVLLGFVPQAPWMFCTKCNDNVFNS